MNKFFGLMLSALVFLLPISVNAQSELTSNTYKIVDSQIDGGAGIADSANYSLLSATDPLGDARLTSGSYSLGTAFPNGIQANVPLIICAEATTTSGTTACLDFPNANGAQGECGSPGCYDSAKIEIDPQDNPIDALYLVSITDTSNSTEYFLQSDHTISTTYDINDYMDLCAIQGKDTRTGSLCQNSGGPNWDADLQRTNVYGLAAETSYDVKARALNGDFTESPYGPIDSFTTTIPTLVFDIDIDDNTGFATETGGVHTIDLGQLDSGSASTATNRIWLDMGTNITPGFNLYVEDLNNGLLGNGYTIPSQSEDLDSDSGDGGFGLKIDTATETSLGPLLSDVTFDTTNPNEVGAVSTTPDIIFATNTTGTNVGPLDSGRASLFVKSIAPTSAVAGALQDTITFTMIPNF